MFQGQIDRNLGVLTTIKIPVTSAMMPMARFVAYYHVNNELVVDSTIMEVEEELPNQVSLYCALRDPVRARDLQKINVGSSESHVFSPCTPVHSYKNFNCQISFSHLLTCSFAHLPSLHFLTQLLIWVFAHLQLLFTHLAHFPNSLINRSFAFSLIDHFLIRLLIQFMVTSRLHSICVLEIKHVIFIF